MRKLIFLLFIELVLFALLSCQPGYTANDGLRYSDNLDSPLMSNEVMSKSGNIDMAYYKQSEEPNSKKELTGTDKSKSVRKLIYNGTIVLLSNNPEETAEALIQFVSSSSGYLVNRYGNNISFRIPISEFESTIDKVANFGEVDTKSIYTNDVTNQYFDTKIWLESSIKARDRYMELLSKAASVEEMLKVEVELERINREIERLQGMIKSWDTQVDYALVSVNVKQKVKPGIVGWVFVGVYESIKWLFVWD